MSDQDKKLSFEEQDFLYNFLLLKIKFNNFNINDIIANDLEFRRECI